MQYDWLQTFAGTDGTIMLTAPLVSTETPIADSTIVGYQAACPLFDNIGSECVCRIPDDVTETVFQDEPMEVPVTKRMVFKFGKPQKKQFIFIDS